MHHLYPFNLTLKVEPLHGDSLEPLHRFVEVINQHLLVEAKLSGENQHMLLSLEGQQEDVEMIRDLLKNSFSDIKLIRHDPQL